jgi:polyferredoxin
MEKTSDILVYSGTILIAFQIVGEMSYLQTLIGLLFAKPLPSVINRITNRNSESTLKNAVLIFLLIILAVVLIIVTIIILPFLLVGIFVGRPLVWINALLNELMLWLMEPWKGLYFAGVREAVKGQRKKLKPTDRKLWQIAKDHKVPFLALTGIVLLTIGFIFQLRQFAGL